MKQISFAATLARFLLPGWMRPLTLLRHVAPATRADFERTLPRRQSAEERAEKLHAAVAKRERKALKRVADQESREHGESVAEFEIERRTNFMRALGALGALCEYRVARIGKSRRVKWTDRYAVNQPVFS
jgi:hypothetical protein